MNACGTDPAWDRVRRVGDVGGRTIGTIAARQLVPLAVGGRGAALKVGYVGEENVGVEVHHEPPVARVEPIARGLGLERLEASRAGIVGELLELAPDEALILSGQTA